MQLDTYEVFTGIVHLLVSITRGLSCSLLMALKFNPSLFVIDLLQC